jgi:hypothetical protein
MAARSVFGAFAAVSALVLAGMPAHAAAPNDAATSCVFLELDNPHPGDTLVLGKYNVGGRATDTSGGAVDRVAIFIDDRNLGGTQIGEALLTPPQNAPALTMQSTLTSAGQFNVLTDLTSATSDTGNHTLFAYAHSSMTGVETALGVAIVLGTEAGGAGATLGSGEPLKANNAADCPPPSPQTKIVVANNQEVQAQTSTPAPSPEVIRVVLDSPNPGAAITRGRFAIEGRASTSTGAAIDRVQAFLDNRDLGGVELGEVADGQVVPVPNTNLSSVLLKGAYHLIADFPADKLGAHTVFVYARSKVTGKESFANTGITISR